MFVKVPYCPASYSGTVSLIVLPMIRLAVQATDPCRNLPRHIKGRLLNIVRMAAPIANVCIRIKHLLLPLEMIVVPMRLPTMSPAAEHVLRKVFQKVSSSSSQLKNTW